MGWLVDVDCRLLIETWDGLFVDVDLDKIDF